MASYKIISQSIVPAHLVRGEIGIMLTDTIYGIVARAADSTAVERLYAAKNREKKPGTVIAASIEQLVSIGIASENLQKVAHFWPNPISVVLPVQPGYLDQEVGSLAVRVVANPAMRAILEQTGPLLTSSANRPGEPESRTINEAIAYFGNTVDFYADSDPITNRPASTIVRPKLDGSLETLRVGSIDPNRLK